MKNSTRRVIRKLPVALKEDIFGKPELVEVAPAVPVTHEVVPLPLDTTPAPKLGSFGVLVLLLDETASPSSAGAIERMSRAWLGREVVFLSAACARLGTQMTTLSPSCFTTPANLWPWPPYGACCPGAWWWL